jgi:hypothetical protein
MAILSSSVSVHYLSNSCTHSTQIWHMDKSWENTGQVRIWSWYDDSWQELRPLMKFSVSVHYLQNGITHSTQIWPMDTSKKCTGQVPIWSWFNDFLQSYAPFTLEIIWNFQISQTILHIRLVFNIWIRQNIIQNFQFPFIFSRTVFYIQLKFDIWIHQRNVQVKFKFVHGLMVFSRVMPLSLWK